MEQTTSVKKRYGKTAIHDSQHKEVLFFASRTSGTFCFAPTAQAITKAKPKEPLPPNALLNS